MANTHYGHAEDSPNDRRNKLLTVVVLVLLSVTLLLVVRGQVQKHYSVHTISGTSMTPTLTEKDQVLVKKKTLIQRYDIVAFSVRKEEGMFVKRVIGLPGDKIFIRNERMVLDLGEQGDFETTYTYQLSPTVAGEFQTLNTIPEEVYFVIGDHVDVSKDSRTFGFVHRKAIEGTVQFRFPAIHLARPNNE
ncbi:MULTISPECIES: signal peptidase I [Enterococcus]|nr:MULTISPECIES: signal peptidase I [Enterococcus]MDN6003289.1 signal peptidase I [Enterococcus sp.]MDN6215724.1 signal peptidase I [Enterococcus sp.]MDN6517383.1 signal peptidase I [Enterococcus sp.]MDN6559813.1 signal peptidase I [Enterococcus sp.]MDN6584351.1 signal peptidase I [Enterococcus sp.]